MNVCMHILNAYEVTMLKHLHLLKYDIIRSEKLNKLSRPRFNKEIRGGENNIQTSDGWKTVPCDNQDKVTLLIA